MHKCCPSEWCLCWLTYATSRARPEVGSTSASASTPIGGAMHGAWPRCRSSHLVRSSSADAITIAPSFFGSQLSGPPNSASCQVISCDVPSGCGEVAVVNRSPLTCTRNTDQSQVYPEARLCLQEGLGRRARFRAPIPEVVCGGLLKLLAGWSWMRC